MVKGFQCDMYIHPQMYKVYIKLNMPQARLYDYQPRQVIYPLEITKKNKNPLEFMHTT